MLQVTDDGAHITLSDATSGQSDGMFWFGFALLIGAIVVAMAMSLLSERLAIGALAVLVVGSFIFNRQRNKQKNSETTNISSGVLKVQQGMFVHNILGNQQQVLLQADDTIQVDDRSLMIKSSSGAVKCQISGFDSSKEAQVMQAVLQGQKFGRRNANIKMQSS